MMQPRTLCISKRGATFTVDDPTRPGSPPVGRGLTMKGAIGDWLHHNQAEMGITFCVDDSAMPAELARRRREMAQR
jgi:hypothetical protein